MKEVQKVKNKRKSPKSYDRAPKSTRTESSLTIVTLSNCFSYNTKLLFWTLFRMLCHGYIFLLSRSNKNIITCQRKIKFHFCVTQKNNLVFCASQIFYIQFLDFTLVAC